MREQEGQEGREKRDGRKVAGEGNEGRKGSGWERKRGREGEWMGKGKA